MGQESKSNGFDRVRAYPEDKDRINDRRQGDDTQADVIRRLLDDDAGEGIPDGILTISEADPEDLDRIRKAMETVEERTGRIERTLEDLR